MSKTRGFWPVLPPIPGSWKSTGAWKHHPGVLLVVAFAATQQMQRLWALHAAAAVANSVGEAFQ